jgi:hypothetical protein
MKHGDPRLRSSDAAKKASLKAKIDAFLIAEAGIQSSGVRASAPPAEGD